MVGLLNYITAGLVVTLFFVRSEPGAITQNVLLAGGIGGFFYFVSFFVLIITTSWKGAANTAVVSRLSILLPVLGGILLWHERPGVLQYAGIALASSSLLLIGLRKAQLDGVQPPPYAFLALASFFVMAGFCRLSQEMFKHLCHPNERLTFLLLIFGISGLASIVVLAVRRRIPSARELTAGLALGIMNLVNTFCILSALESLPGYVVFPMTSAGGLLFTTAIAVLFLEERLSRLSIAGIAIAIFSLGLLQTPVGEELNASSSELPARPQISVRAGPTAGGSKFEIGTLPF